jgi:hypothetical protein
MASAKLGIWAKFEQEETEVPEEKSEEKLWLRAAKSSFAFKRL